MRDPVDVPFFLRLGRRMRGTEGAAIGQLRRVKISDVVVSNCGSKQATLITGIPGHSLEDIQLSNIYMLHQGGGTADAAGRSLRLRMSIPIPTASLPCRRMDFSSVT